MRKITGILTKELSNKLANAQVTKSEAFPVKSFRELMGFVSQLSYLNKDYLLFYRGQGADYLNKSGASTIYPSIYRGDRLSKDELDIRFDILTSASRRLSNALQEKDVQGWQDVKRRKYIQWSILQHYEVCATPLLDLTHSLRVACSFAFLSSKDDEPIVHVFGLPYVTNRVSVNSEHDIVNIRLLSICPPDALRPYYQEGYLAGTDDITIEYEAKQELDFNNRLIAKFRLRNKNFWGKGFNPIPESVLYPEKDHVKDICSSIQEELGTEISPSQLGKFLQEWTNLENMVLELARKYPEKVFSFREAIFVLLKKEILNYDLQKQLDGLRQFRNLAVHNPKKLSPNDLTKSLSEIKDVTEQIKKIKN